MTSFLNPQAPNNFADSPSGAAAQVPHPRPRRRLRSHVRRPPGEAGHRQRPDTGPSPRANAIAERVVRSIRTECLDHAIVINERHPHVLLAGHVNYYNVDRPNRSLGLQSPLPRSPTRDGRVIWRPVLGGLDHVYARAA